MDKEKIDKILDRMDKQRENRIVYREIFLPSQTEYNEDDEELEWYEKKKLYMNRLNNSK